VKYQLTHTTRYNYENLVSVAHHRLCLTPRRCDRQHLHAHDLHIDPTPAQLTTGSDYFGNTSTFLTLDQTHQVLVLTAHTSISVLPTTLPLPAATPPWEEIRDLVDGARFEPAGAPVEFAFSSPFAARDADFGDYATRSFTTGRPILDGCADLMRRIHTEFTFDPTATTVATPLKQVFKKQRGVCQDFAHLQIACLRSLGLPARYVSGYLETQPPPGKARLVGADASHAWVQVWCGLDFGWIDLDPTNNTFPSERHIILAWGRDFGDVSPARGVLSGGGRHKLDVAVDVVPLPG
jgi:transglutaminase-like putative cysteine protease